jgi:phosphoribosylanthranilate isomerase
LVTRIKICGITRPEDAELAASLGAHALGFVFEPSSPRFLDPKKENLSWLADLSPYTQRVAVYGVSLPNPWGHLFSLVQSVHWEHEPEPWQRRIHVKRLKPGETHDDEVPSDAVCLVLEAYSEAGFGGTGVRVDWPAAAAIVERSTLPVVLAGGLTPENVREAIRVVRPYAVDVSSGIERSPGIKDPDLMRAFINNVLLEAP